MPEGEEMFNIRAISKVASIIHYPECWDTMAYPTIADALCELLTCSEHECSTCADAKDATLKRKMTPKKGD